MFDNLLLTFRLSVKSHLMNFSWFALDFRTIKVMMFVCCNSVDLVDLPAAAAEKKKKKKRNFRNDVLGLSLHCNSTMKIFALALYWL
jgi:hypothetical protein